MSSNSRITCPLCPKTYSRLDHLQRHLANHAPWRPFVCSSCTKSFKRKDVLRRHSIVCNADHEPHNKQTKTPTKVRPNRTACDECARLKRACDSRQPCGTCAARNETCSYGWLQDDVSDNAEEQHLHQPEDSRASEMLSALIPIPPTSELPSASLGIGGTSHSLTDNSTNQPQLASTSFNLPPGELDSWWTVTEELSRDQDFTAFALDPEIIDCDHAPHESFSFLVRFTSNEEGMSGAFDIDSKVVTDNVWDSGLSEEGGSNSFSDLGDPKGPDELPLLSFHPQADGVFAAPFASTDGLSLEPLSSSFHAGASSIQNESQPGWTVQKCQDAQPQDRSSTGKGPMYSHLAPKSHQIFTAIKRTTLSQVGNDYVNKTGTDYWSPFLEGECVDFFQPANLHRFLEYFWALWYPNAPTIHKPSFDATTAPHTLLAAMALIGASLSPHEDDNSRAKLWFDVVEKIVFHDETTYNLEEATCIPFPLECLESRLRALQASYAVCLFQNWEGRQASRGRIRRKRYGMVIALARALLPYANHPDLDRLDLHRFSWTRFIIREEVIRSVLYVFLLDTAFTIFNNLPPRMVLRETTCDLACPEPCFQAPTAMGCFQKIQKWVSHPLYKKGIAFHTAVRVFRRKTLDAHTTQYLSHCGILNLWTITSAFHSLLFNLDPGFSSGAEFESLRNAIDNWRVVWDLQSERGSSDCFGTHDPWIPQFMATPEAPWKRIGFFRNAPEYWLLARVMLERVEAARQRIEANEVFFGSGDARDSGIPPTLAKFDETSMAQLRNFITSFQELSIAE